MERLDHPDTPDADLAVAATGLIEIGVEHYERAADVFRHILRTRTKEGVRDAALGLSALGPQEAAEAVAALTRLATDRALEIITRVPAANTLAALGPQHRAAAGQLLVALAEDPSTAIHGHWIIAESLARFGPDFLRPAERLLRATIVHPESNAHARHWAAKTLSDLGSEYQDEAAQAYWEVAADPFASGYDRAASLAQLAMFGDPYRAEAVVALRALVADEVSDQSARCYAAGELARLGPEYHAEVTRTLVAIAESNPEPGVARWAWRKLMDLRPDLRGKGKQALLSIALDDDLPWHRNLPMSQPDTDDAPATGRLLAAALSDPSRFTWSRVGAARRLLDLGTPLHRQAVESLIDLLRSEAITVRDVDLLSAYTSRVSRRLRAHIIAAVKAVVLVPDATEDLIVALAHCLHRLDHRKDPDVLAALSTVVGDRAAPASTRLAATVALARAVPARRQDVVQKYPVVWAFRVRELAALGADVGPALLRELDDRVTPAAVRSDAAFLLGQLCPDLAGQAVGELRSQVADKCAPNTVRAVAYRRLAILDPAATDEAAAFCRAVVTDPGETADSRVSVADELRRLDRTAGPAVVALLRRMASDPECTAAERGSALDSLLWESTAESGRLAGAVVRSPDADSAVRSRMVRLLRESERFEIELALLADHTAAISDRLPGSGWLGERWFVAETEEMLRDVLAAPEFSVETKIDAAAALGRIVPEFALEAAVLLERWHQWYELAAMGPAWRRHAVELARQEFDDCGLPLRRRLAAARLLLDYAPEEPHEVLDFLRGVVRVDALDMLRRTDGDSALRSLLHDETASPAVRWAVANRFREYGAEDRATSVRVLAEIAGSGTRVALRWRAGRDLMGFGVRGRELGVAALQAVVQDTEVVVTARANAAEVIGLHRPDLRAGMVRFLRTLRADRPLHQVVVLKSLGTFAPHEAALALREVAADRSVGAVVRVRAAEGVAELWRDFREAAAVVVREVARDGAVPRHVRRRAARDLALWSELCRDEARELLVVLSGVRRWSAGGSGR
ncbi:hypothetical protein [Saccharothrix obliqua]|uniref:hypothetical protein n=1 Tax=Saccharothrix obliqua TaxID=2861747 RepID=UPI001C5DD4DF|nr:hypothetical protein [Saccharothrix obliqua]MBW4718487.1 hypothetical protein [Saccharothrix obliqua]